MMIGFVSDERYAALPEVLVTLRGPSGFVSCRSGADGSIVLRDAIPPGPYVATLACEGYGSKRVAIDIPTATPRAFRLLSESLLGYAWPKWVRSGDRSEFRVHSSAPYQLTLRRLGIDPEQGRNLGWFDEHGPRATAQITPDGDYSQTGVRWNEHGFVNPHHRQSVTAPDQSGLYYFFARTRAGACFGFPWIVAPAAPSAPIAVIASNLNWNAYNAFGGRSNYINPDRLPPEPIVHARRELRRYTDPESVNYDVEGYAPLSFDRPEPKNHLDPSERVTDPIEGRDACHLAPAEWRLLAWLEREGFTCDLYAESQLNDGALDLDAYRALVLGPHPEYWTRRMFDRVRDWVWQRGGRLLYLGGNGLNCEVELVEPHAMICRNGRERRVRAEGWDSRFHLRTGASEASLLGVAFTDAGIMTAAPYQVQEAKHWLFEGTGLDEGDVFGIESLHKRCEGGASGHETDKVTKHSPSGVRVVARGMNPDDGGAELSLYATDSGGAVFAAGSVTYAASLLVDEPLSRVTANAVRRFLDNRPVPV